MGARFIHGNKTDVGYEMQSYENAIVMLEKCVDELHNQAESIATKYWDFVNGYEKKSTGWESRSSMQLSCYRRGNHIEIKWTGIKWYGSKGKRTSLRIPITKNPELFSYHETKLKVHSKDWEFEMVKETELKMQSIRRQAHHVVRAIMSIRNAKQVNRVTPIFENESNDSPEPDSSDKD